MPVSRFEPESMEVNSQARLNSLLYCIFVKCVRIIGQYSVFLCFSLIIQRDGTDCKTVQAFSVNFKSKYVVCEMQL